MSKLEAIFDDLPEIGKVIWQLPFGHPGEGLQRSDSGPESPYFVLIQPETPEETRQGVPILYAPGYLDDPRTLRETCRRYANELRCPVYIVKYRSRFQAIDQHAKDFARIAERMLLDTKQSDLILIGHSMGGLVIQTYLHDYMNAHILFWITIGTPFKGSPLASLGFGTCAREMYADSEFIKRINEPGSAVDLPSLHIFTGGDLLVPPEYAKREGGPKAVYYEAEAVHGHMGVRSCLKVEKVIVQAIRDHSVVRGIPKTS